MNTENSKLHGREIEYFMIFTLVMLFLLAFICDTPMGILRGMKLIICSTDTLITDYIKLAGYGAAFFNAALLQLLAMTLIKITKIPYTGLTIVSVLLNLGFGLWGKNIVNVLPIIAGTFLYSALHRAKFARFVCIGLNATGLAPMISGMVWLLPFEPWLNLIVAVVIGLFIGFAVPPLAMHTTSMHMGYCLTNVGFASGVFAVVLYSVLRSIGLSSETVLVWTTGIEPYALIVLTGYLLLTFFYGLWLENGSFVGLKRITRHPGRAVADFIITDTPGATLMNMALLGLLGVFYVFIIGGDFSGPMIGCILILFAFGSFGAHIKNYPPVLLGVHLSTFFTIYEPDTPAIQVAAIFSVALAPICGQFGAVAGLAAGIIHVMMVMCTSQFYGGLNLYNNGFSAGWVAIIMIPIMESFMKRFGKKKGKG